MPNAADSLIWEHLFVQLALLINVYFSNNGNVETVECGVAGVACGLWSADCAVWPVRSGWRSRADVQAAEASSKADDRGRSKSQKKGQPANHQRRFVVDSGQWTHLTSLTVSPDCVTAHCHCGEGSDEPTVESQERTMTVARESRR
ncbi:Hypothetical predicted protein [Olea europaea subsp. europaea]|uniref:Secreted protein n=1 Tax=Olea europaea subsp. europaea TaxID=158383 RepID=A0A8S0UZP5_OLEEU|nr:Hypothetical predicted protein [Olea europaea subsp. europaea]